MQWDEGLSTWLERYRDDLPEDKRRERSLKSRGNTVPE